MKKGHDCERDQTQIYGRVWRNLGSKNITEERKKDYSRGKTERRAIKHCLLFMVQPL